MSYNNNYKNKYKKSYSSYGGKSERGLINQNNSCYCDVTIFSMFARTEIFDYLFFYNIGEKSKSKRENKKKDNNIVDTHEIYNTFCNAISVMRSTKCCPPHLVQEFRDSLCVVNSRMESEMMDVEEFITTFFGRALNLPHFIRYSVGTGAFLHQLFLMNNNGGVGIKLMDVQTAFQQSMQNQGLTLAAVPVPALFVKIPRGRDEVNRRSPVIPNIILDVSSSMVEDGKKGHTCTKLELLAVICLRSYHYTTFVREKKKTWCYFDSLSGVDIVFDDVEEELISLEKDSKFFKRLSYHTQIMVTTIHMCIYKPLDEESELEKEGGIPITPSSPSPSSSRNKNNKMKRAKISHPSPYEKKSKNVQMENNWIFNQFQPVSTELVSTVVENPRVSESHEEEKIETMEKAQIPENSIETFSPGSFEEQLDDALEKTPLLKPVDEEAAVTSTKNSKFRAYLPPSFFSYADAVRSQVRGIGGSFNFGIHKLFPCLQNIFMSVFNWFQAVLHHGALEQSKVDSKSLLNDSEMDVEESEVACDPPLNSEAHESYPKSTLV